MPAAADPAAGAGAGVCAHGHPSKVAAEASGVTVQDPPASLEPEEFMDFTAPHAIRCREHLVERWFVLPMRHGRAFSLVYSGQAPQATAAAYNIGPVGFSGNPNTIDQGTSPKGHGNYGSDVVGLMSCFK